MKKLVWGAGFALLFGMVISCGQNGKSDVEKGKEIVEKAMENIQDKEAGIDTEFVSEQKTIEGHFVMVALSTDGAIYLVEDKDGEQYEFFDRNPDAKGLDFLHDYPANEPIKALENEWFDILYENRMLEFYDGGTGEDISREELVILKVTPL